MAHIPHKRRVYYDHENVYRRYREQGYRGWVQPDAPDQSAKLDAITAFLESKHAPSPGRALDFGCGGGEASILLAERGWQVVGVDYSETAVEMARENAQGLDLPVEFLVGDITKPLPVEPGSFSLVLDCNVLHCLIGPEDRMAFLGNAFGALGENGVMLSTGMTAEGYLNYEAANGINPDIRVDVYNTRYWATLRELLQEFVGAGFGVRYVSLEQEPLKDECGAGSVIYAVKTGG